MAKGASKPKSPTSTPTSASNPSEISDGRALLRIKATTKMKEVLREESRHSSWKNPKTEKKMKKTAKVDSRKPKKPPTAFFYFLQDFRKEYQEQNPDIKSMRDIGRACGEKWKTMKYEEKVHYYDVATEKRAEFDRAMKDYVRIKESGEDQE